MKVFTWLLVIFMVPAAAYQGGEPLAIEPGDSRVDGTIIESYTARWRQWVVEADGMERAGINTITDAVTVDTNAGHVVRDLVWADTENNTYRRIDTLDRETLAPLRMHVLSSPHAVTHVDLTDGRLRATVIDDATSAAQWTEADLGRAAFNWSSDGFLLAAISLTDISDLSLSTLGNLTSAPEVGSITFRVIGHETIQTIPFGTHHTTVVRQTGSSSYWGQYWISEAPPYVVRVRFSQEGGAVTTWELF